MLRIALVISNLNIHGGVRRCIELANALVARGHWVTVYTPEGKPCEWWPCAAPVERCAEMKGYYDAACLLSFDRDFVTWLQKADVACRMLYMVSLNEQNPAAILESQHSQDKLLCETLRSPDWMILACATWIHEWLVANVRPDAELLIGGINRTIFHPEGRRRSERIVLSSGDKREREGSVAVSKAVQEVAKVFPDVKLETYFKKGIPQAEMARVYSDADVYLDGQWYAGWANAPVEAMACKTPVVCTNIGGVRDFAEHEVTALVVPVEDVQAMAYAVVRLMKDKALRERLVNAAYDRVAQWDYARMAERFERIVCQRSNQ